MAGLVETYGAVLLPVVLFAVGIVGYFLLRALIARFDP